MRILITGAFGNIGRLLIPALIKRGFIVRCFDLPTGKNRAKAKRLDQAEIVYGDIRKKGEVECAVKDCEVIIHLAFAPVQIPDRKTNIEGTFHIVKAAEKSPQKPKIIFASSASVHFYNQNCPVRYLRYTKDKLISEKIIKASNLDWCILRIGAILPTKIPSIDELLHIPYNTRMEFVHIKDVITAFAEAINKASQKTLLIGGGKEFQKKYGEFVRDVASLTGQKLPRRKDFSIQPYPTDWLDTKESQKILQYQKHSYKDFLKELKKKVAT